MLGIQIDPRLFDLSGGRKVSGFAVGGLSTALLVPSAAIRDDPYLPGAASLFSVSVVFS